MDAMFVLMPDDIENRINELLVDPHLLELVNLQNRPNLFSTLAASHTEMWHSAFVKWLIDPASHLGLGDFPLKRFLFAVMQVGGTSPTTRKPELSLGGLEDMVLDRMEFETEFSFYKSDNKRIDIIGVLEEVPLSTRDREITSVRIIIENKINAREASDQTATYYELAKRSSDNFRYDFFIFLTPDESQMPRCEHFVQLTYQDLCDLIIRPCLRHPGLPEESKYLLHQYLLNLRNPIRGGRVMALANKELCERIYSIHKDVLDEIFLSVKDMVPQKPFRGSRIRRATVTIEQLVGKGILTMQDELYATHRGTEYRARLGDDAGVVGIDYNGMKYDNPSRVAKDITKTSVNGWSFWNVRDANGVDKGLLGDPRRKLDFD